MDTYKREVTESLLRSGKSSVRDVAMAFYVLKVLEYADSIVFPETPCEILLRDVSGLQHFAEYNQTLDFYGICVPNLAKRFQEDAYISRHIFDSNGDLLSGQGLHSRPFVQARVTAIHEVRHRIQHTLAITQKFNRNSRSDDRFLQRIILFVHAYFSKIKEEMLAEGCAQSEIEKVTDPEEFDAKVVEKYALHRPPIDRESFRKILLLQPTN